MEENTSGEVSSGQKKFCINCAHIGTTGSKDISQYKCFAPQNKFELNLIDGSKDYYNTLCYTNRYNDNFCSKDGNWYVQVPVTPPITPLYTPVNQANKKPPAIDLADLLGM